MDDFRKLQILSTALRALREQLREAVKDRNAAWLELARIATAEEGDWIELRRMARRACPGDPMSVRAKLEPRSERA